MEHSLQEANRLKSEFLANMSHELRTPLNAILGFACLMRDDVKDPPSADHKDYLRDIVASGQHLLRLINDILDLAKVESGKLEFHFEVVDLAQVVAEVRDILRGVAASKRLRVEIDVHADAREAVLDPSRLKQVLYNLLSNAFKFTPERGRVSVTVRCEDRDFLRIEVADTGLGIAAADFDRLFVEFEQLDGSSSKRFQGTGLGLVLTKRIVEANGGWVEVRSARGFGSTFCVCLPRFVSSNPAVVRPPSFRVASPLALLLVGFESPARERLSRLLGDISTRVDYAVESSSAVQLCEQHAYDAIVFDPLPAAALASTPLTAMRSTILNSGIPAFALRSCEHIEHATAVRVEAIVGKQLGENGLLMAVQQALPGKGSVLAIDDDPSALRLLDAALTRLGYQLLCTQSASAALELVNTTPPDLVVLDLIMEGMDGFEFIARAQQLTRAKSIPVVIWTAKELGSEERARLLRSAESVSTKAFASCSTIVDQIRALLERKLPAPQDYHA